MLYISADGLGDGVSIQGSNESIQEFSLDDLMIFTRVPLFVIIDSDNSNSFLDIEKRFDKPLVVLSAPEYQPSTISGINSNTLILEPEQAGSLFTFFLHNPLDAFCLCTLNHIDIEQTIYNTIQTTLNTAFVDCINDFHHHKDILRI